MESDNVEITILKAPMQRGERHPGVAVALQYIKSIFPKGNEALVAAYLEQFRNNEDFHGCAYALEHLLNGKVVSDAYLMNLALVIQGIEEEMVDDPKNV